MKKLFLFLIPVVLLAFAGCHGFGFGCHGYGVRGSGVTKDETRNPGNFSAVDIGGAFDVEINNGASASVTLSGDDNLLKLIKTDVEGNTLHVYTKKNISPKRKLKLVINVENIEKVDISGACDVKVHNIDADKFDMNVSGASKLFAAGKAKDVSLDISGAGKVSANELISKRASVEISGAAKADIYASEDLRAEISGVGSLDYYGNPKNVKQSVSGVGSISQK